MKRRKILGGFQQLQRAQELMVVEGAGSASSGLDQDGPLDGDPEVETLTELWAAGVITALILQQIAFAACQVAPRPQMEVLSRLGYAGVHTGNAHRDLMVKLKMGNNKVPDPYLTYLPAWDERPKPRPRQIECNFPFMLPHEMLSFLYSEFRDEFNKRFLGTQPLAQFWNNISTDDPRLQGHPMHNVQGWRDVFIPLRIHGDAVPVGKSKKRSADIISMSSITGQDGNSLDTKLLIFFCISGAKFKGSATTPSTMDQAWRVILWSLKACFRNKWPDKDWNGNAMTGWRAERAGDPLCGGSVCGMAIGGRP